MFYPFPIVTNLGPEKIKEGREFQVLGHRISIHSIPPEWNYTFLDDRILIGRKDSGYTTYNEIKTMLIIAEATHKKINFSLFMKGLDIPT